MPYDVYLSCSGQKCRYCNNFYMNYNYILQPTFKVKYSMSLVAYLKDFQIAVGTLSTLGVIFAGYKTWAWSKRAGRLAIDFAAIVNFMFFVSGVLSNVFFVITFGIAFYFFIFYKVRTVLRIFIYVCCTFQRQSVIVIGYWHCSSLIIKVVFKIINNVSYRDFFI